MRILIATTAAGLALVAALPATASARNPRPTTAQATPIARQLAERAAEGVRSFGIYEIEHVSVWCGHPLDRGSRSVKCAYALSVRNTGDGASVTCLNSVYVTKSGKGGRLHGRYGSQLCF